MSFKTADLCDQFSDELEVCEPLFHDYGGNLRFGGQIVTLKCFEDNSRVRDVVEENGAGRIIVVDAGGSKRRAVLGDLLAKKAATNGWAGLIIFGCVRDSAEIATMNLGVKAIGTCPLKTDKRNEGQRDLPVRFGGVMFKPGDWVYADEDGVIVARRRLI